MWEFRTCIHGVTEGLDYHDCAECQELAKSKGLPPNGWQTRPYNYIFTLADLEPDIS